MTWVVVRFKEENTVEAVPKKWFLTKESACYWPPKSYDNAAIKSSIKNQHSPDSKWMKYTAILLGTYGKYCLYYIIINFYEIILCKIFINKK